MDDQFIVNSAILDKQKEKLLNFKTQGFPGVEEVEGSSLDNIRDLFLNGSSVYSIAQEVELSEEIVLYYVVFNKWDQKRHDMMQAIEDTIMEKIMDTKLKGVEAMTKILNVASDMFVNGIDQYLKTKDEKFLVQVGIKSLKDYKTAVEVLKAFTASGSSNVNTNSRGAQKNIRTTRGTVRAVELPTAVVEVEVESKKKSLSDIAKEKRKVAKGKIRYER